MSFSAEALNIPFDDACAEVDGAGAAFAKGDFEVRAEIVMTKAEFKRFNADVRSRCNTQLHPLASSMIEFGLLLRSSKRLESDRSTRSAISRVRCAQLQQPGADFGDAWLQLACCGKRLRRASGQLASARPPPNPSKVRFVCAPTPLCCTSIANLCLSAELPEHRLQQPAAAAVTPPRLDVICYSLHLPGDDAAQQSASGESKTSVKSFLSFSRFTPASCCVWLQGAAAMATHSARMAVLRALGFATDEQSSCVAGSVCGFMRTCLLLQCGLGCARHRERAAGLAGQARRICVRD